MIALDLPPQLQVPAKPAILRMAEPWRARLNADMAAAGVPRHVRRAVVAEVARLAGLPGREARPAIVRATLADIARWGDAPLLASMPGIGGAIAGAVGQAGAALSLTYVDGTISTGGGTGTQTLTLPTGSAEGDLMILMGATIGNPTNNTLPYSLTKLYTLSANGANTRLYIGAKILGSSESSSATWSIFTVANTLGLLTFRPDIALSGFAINGETGDTRNGADPTALSLDLSGVTEPCLKIGFYANQHSTVSHSESPAMTSRLDNGFFRAYADFYGSSPVSQTSFDEASGTNVGQALAYLTFT